MQNMSKLYFYLQMLRPHQFTRDQLRALMQQLEVTSPDRVLLSQWKANRWIKVLTKNQFEKLV